MKKRFKFLSILTAGAVACTVTLAGCSLVSADSQADMEQVIATVDITKSESLDSSLTAYTGAIGGGTSIIKRELVAYFLNAGSSLVQNGSTYGEAFATLADTLVNNAVLVQYATLATLKDMAEDASFTEFSDAAGAVEWFNSFESDTERYEAILDYQATVDKYDGTENVDYVLLTQYTIMSSLNNSIDSYEETYLDVNTDDETSSATLPTGVDTELDNYYPVDESGNLDYGVYTGYDDYLLGDSGIYEDDHVEGTTTYSRRRAYNNFIQVLDANYLIAEDEDVTDVMGLGYVQTEYENLLKQQMLLNYYDLYEAELEQTIDANDYAYVQERYEELVNQQTAEYNSSLSSFETAMGSLADDSFITYVPDTENGNKFGYVYNILLPFDAVQTSQLSVFSAQLENDVIDENEYYFYRNQLLKNAQTTDQRSAWFNGGVDYSFDASGTDLDYYGKDEGRNTLFFENNLLHTDRYESLDKYYGMYTYNGVAVQNEDESYTLIPNKLDISDLLSEFENYIEFVAGNTDAVEYLIGAKDNGAYYNENNFYYEEGSAEGDVKDIDYSKFMYAYGKVDLGNFTASDLMNKESLSYKIMSAVNELQYAYTTDTAVLSEYLGYDIGAYSTDYIAEFEYATQYAIREGGAGSFAVCAGDYGWHLIYVTYVLEPGQTVYNNPDWTRIETEGTFENLFYEMLRTSDLENASSRHQLDLLQALYQDGSSVTVYEDRFSDLTSLTTGGSDSSSSGSSGSSSGSSSTTS